MKWLGPWTLGVLIAGCVDERPTATPSESMMSGIPDDVNGDVLRRMLASGDDLSKSRDIEFVHVMPSEEAGKWMAEQARELGFSVRVHRSQDDWETTCVRDMVPNHAAITKAEAELARLAEGLGGHADGWGCFDVR